MDYPNAAGDKHESESARSFGTIPISQTPNNANDDRES